MYINRNIYIVRELYILYGGCNMARTMSVRLDDDTLDKLEYIKNRTGLNASASIRLALSRLYFREHLEDEILKTKEV